MKISTEEFNTFKEPSEGLVLRLKTEVENSFERERCDLEDDIEFEYEGNTYELKNVDSDVWEDDGKYSFSCDTYQLVSYKNREMFISDYFNMFVSVPVSRCGSYFTDYDYYYDEPTYFKGKIEYIPKVIIPAHEEVKFD